MFLKEFGMISVRVAEGFVRFTWVFEGLGGFR